MTTAEQPPLSLVKSPTPVEGTVVEHQGGGRVVEPRPRPVWTQSAEALRQHAAYARDNVLDWAGHHVAHSPYYVGWSVRGYRRLGRRWLDAHRDDYPQMIQSLRQALRDAAGDPAAEAKLKAMLEARRAEYRRSKRVHWAKSGGWTLAAAGGGATGVVFGGLWVEILIALAFMAIGARHGRPTAEEEAAAVRLAAPVPEGAEVLSYDPPLPPALSDDALTTALRDINLIKPGATVKVLVAPVWGTDGTATTVFDLPSGVTVNMLRKKSEELASALGRDSSMIDVTKAGAAGRASLWMSDVDPFEAPRPSPLLTSSGGLDAWKDGVPVAWSKRGTAVRLPIKNSNFLIGGMTRSGKGVGAANLIAGAALDVRINLRIVAGKHNGEWDAYAKAGVAATYFKPSPERLLALLKAELAEKGRREAELGRLGKSKLIPEVVTQLGGIELVVVDEQATYTRPGKPLRDEILEDLIELSAVAAGAGILVVLITQYPEADVIPQGLAMNCGTRWAMRVDNATQSNAILGGGASGSGRDASKFDPPIPGLGWLVNPFAGVIDLARSFDLDEDERGEVSLLLSRAAELRKVAGRLAGQWDDPIEKQLLAATGSSSVAGGPEHNGVPGRDVRLSGAQQEQVAALQGALAAIDQLERPVAQLDEMARLMGGNMAGDQLGEILRRAGAGGTTKVTIEGRGRVNGYRREDISEALKFLQGA
ncbi:hypothetical protein [Streptomyces albireticuli]|uniref:FtsK domain-containing protein n=1 Tax=Streptomyces albireticuli TaxID=1940 RepID=A0A2A2D4W5_9ACTN|nr:hypothetical protein [Streptomyces albireticuli]MCD9196059.1 hypothetical protein [Streptomyces albireticuli]PAU46551.1 hypothetical protein CK936_23445 [Streptomyces albireticuli]